MLADSKTKLISIHSLPKEGDDTRCVIMGVGCYFNPLPPQGGRPAKKAVDSAIENISIHSLPKEGDRIQVAIRRLKGISIHSLPKEGDSIALATARIAR